MKRHYDGINTYCPYCGSMYVKEIKGDVCCGKFRCKDCGNCYTLSNDNVVDVKLLEATE